MRYLREQCTMRYMKPFICKNTSETCFDFGNVVTGVKLPTGFFVNGLAYGK